MTTSHPRTTRPSQSTTTATATASTPNTTHAANAASLPQPPSNETSFFEQQREELINEIAIHMENALQNINRLNRSLEGVLAVGNEFGAVEALWSQFEGVMAKEEEEEDDGELDEEDEGQGSRKDGEGEEKGRGEGV